MRQSLLDLKQTFADGVVVDQVPLTIEWRITQGLQSEIGVDTVVTDLSGRELAEVLQKVDAVISTPSTSMIEAMLLGLPVAVLDYCNCPHYVQPAWRITAAEQILPVLAELVATPAPKMLFQETTLHDTLECASPAAPRLLRLADEMLRRGQAARAAGVAPVFPARLVPVEGGVPAVTENRFDPAALYPGHAPFSERNLHALQVEVGQLRTYAAQLEQGRGAARPMAGGDAEKLRAYAQVTIQWRSKLESAAALSALKQPKAALDLLLQSIKVVETCKDPQVILEALLDVSKLMVRHDTGRARVLLETALKLAPRLSRPDAVQLATDLLATLPPAARKGDKAA